MSGQLYHFFKTLLLTLFFIGMYYYVSSVLCMVSPSETVSIKLEIDILIKIPLLLLLFIDRHKIYSLCSLQARIKLYNIKIIRNNHQT